MPYPRPKPPAGSVKANYPGFIAPALATSITKVPSGDRWIHEVKFDGYRVQVHIVNEAVRIFHPARSRLNQPFQKIAADAWHVNAKPAIIDAEVTLPATEHSERPAARQIDHPARTDKQRLYASR